MAPSTRPRLPLDPVSRMPSMQTFGELSQFLRAAAADEESLQLSDSMGQVVAHTEAIAAVLAQPADNGGNGNTPQLAQALGELSAVLRGHLDTLEAMSGGWHGHFEYRSYRKALKHFIEQVAQWGRQVRDPMAPALSGTSFEVNAWRVLGIGALLIDAHDQPITLTEEPSAKRKPGLFARAKAWLARRTSSSSASSSSSSSS